MRNLKWFKLPLIHFARWNSRAGYCLIANFLLPNWQQRLPPIVHFSGLNGLIHQLLRLDIQALA